MSAFGPAQIMAMAIEEMIESVKGGDPGSAETLGKTIGVGVRMRELEARAKEALTEAQKSDDQELREAASAALKEINARIG